MNQECAVGYASEADMDAWMDLVALVRDAFPGLSLGEYRGNLRKAIAERRALCAKDARGLLGVLVLSDQHNGIGFLAVHPEARGRGVASALVRMMLDVLPADQHILRDDVPGRRSARCGSAGPVQAPRLRRAPNLSPAMGIHVSNSCCGAVPGTSKGRAAGTLGPVRRTVGPSTAPSIARMPDGAVHLLGTLALFAGMTCFREPFMKYEWKKHEKAMYLPKAVPAPVTVPEHAFFYDTRGREPERRGVPRSAIGVLYALSYAVKMLPKKGDAPEGYYEYAVFPLEGVWDTGGTDAAGRGPQQGCPALHPDDPPAGFCDGRTRRAHPRRDKQEKAASPLCVGLFRALERWLVCANAPRRPVMTTNPVSFNMMQAYCAEHGLRRASGTATGKCYLLGCPQNRSGTSENGTAGWRGALCLRTHPSTTKAASLQKTREGSGFFTWKE